MFPLANDLSGALASQALKQRFITPTPIPKRGAGLLKAQHPLPHGEAVK